MNKYILKFLLLLSSLVIGSYLIFLYWLIKMQYTALIIIIRLFDAISWIMPPALPIFFQLVKTFSLVRLKKNGVLGVDPDKTLTAG